MLTWFRDNAKIFLIAIIVTFVVLIFVDWGTGRMRDRGGALGAIARVDGRDVPPEEYDATISSVYMRLEGQMQSAGHPDPEAELAAMSYRIRDAAFDEMVDNRLRDSYLRRIHWSAPDEVSGEAYIRAILEMMGTTDVDAAWRQFAETPGFQSQFYQNVLQMKAAMFPAACRMQNMASRAELSYFIASSYMPVTARFVAFRATPPIPGPEALRSFYDSHPALFTYPPNARVRYAVVAVQPGSSDIEAAQGVVDSLAMSQSSPDTMLITRGNMLAFMGVDSIPPTGSLSQGFTGQSMRGTGLPSAHRVMVTGVAPSADDPGAGDTLTVLHWESPVLPSRDALYATVQGVEDNITGLLAGSVPMAESLMVMDWGELYVEEDGVLPEGIPEGMRAFALDTAWVDSIGPVFFSPSYRGGYPALIVARMLDRSLDTRLVPFEEVEASGELLMTAYTAAAAESSLAMAARALDEIEASGSTLGIYASAESLPMGTTPEFTSAEVRGASLADPESYGGLLTNGDFALASITAPLLTPIGPFRTGGGAMIAEIISRTELPMPSDPAVLAPMYLGVQTGHGSIAALSLLDILREGASVEDLRADFEQALRESRNTQEPEPVLPAGY